MYFSSRVHDDARRASISCSSFDIVGLFDIEAELRYRTTTLSKLGLRYRSFVRYRSPPLRYRTYVRYRGPPFVIVGTFDIEANSFDIEAVKKTGFVRYRSPAPTISKEPTISKLRYDIVGMFDIVGSGLRYRKYLRYRSYSFDIAHTYDIEAVVRLRYRRYLRYRS